MKNLHFLTHSLMLVMLSVPVRAQSQDSLTADNPLAYNITFNASARLLRGTFNQSVYAGGLDIILNKRSWEVHNTTSYRYNNFNGAQVEDNWYQLLLLSYFFKDRHIIPIAFYLFDNNLLFRVNARHMAGGGIGFIHDKWKGTFIRLDAGAGYESTLYDGTDFANTSSTNPQRNKSLAFVRLIHTHAFLEKKISFSNTMVFRQSLIEGADFYLLIRPKLSLTVLKNLSVNVNFEYRYEHVYLSTLSAANTTFLAGLTYKIQRKKG